MDLASWLTDVICEGFHVLVPRYQGIFIGFMAEKLREKQAKGEALMHLMKALAAAGVHVQMDFDPIREKVVIRYLQSERPIHVVNVAMDNAAAMMFDIFKQAGKELVEEA